MRPLRSSLARAAAALASMALSGSANAQQPEAVRIDYAAPADCPDAAAFAEQVSSRSERARFAQPGELGRTLVVRVSRHSRGRVVGRLTLRETNGTETARAVDGASCDEVVSGLALIAAVALDPNAPPPTPPTAPTPPTPTEANDAPKSAETAAKPEAKKETDATAPGPVKASAPPIAEPGRAWELAFGADGEVVAGISPTLLASLPVFVELSRRTSGDLFSPSARLRFERPGNEQPGGAAHFIWTEASLDLCPVAWWHGERVRVQTCVRTEAGALQATGANVAPARSSVRPWFSMGAVGAVRVVVFRPIFVEIEAALLAPFVRDRFFVEPNTTVFRPSAVAFSAGAGAGVAIW